MAFAMLLNPAFSDEQLHVICETAHVIACECPAQLVDLLRRIRAFRGYTTDCIQIAPDETEIHLWLAQELAQLEALLSETLVEFMRREDLLDSQQQLDLGKLGERNRQAALRQWQAQHLNSNGTHERA
ncbi:MAG: hypothetical protein F6K28_54745 [Microcoleus sp. SIO2G3]|nr:hypothetical protein [Microcoleus sp. SIO2G3]